MKTLFSLRKKLGIRIYQEELNEKYIITELFCLENNKYFKYSTQIIMAIPVVIMLISAIIIRLLELSKTTQITMFVTISVIVLILSVHLILKGLLYFPLDSKCIIYIKHEYPDLFNQVKKKGIQVMGSAKAGKAYRRKEVAVNKDRIEQLITPENKKDNGYYSEEYGFMSVESIEELKKIQAELKKEGISCTLLETEVFWSSFCQETRYASWIEFSDFENTLDDESKEFAKSFFFE